MDEDAAEQYDRAAERHPTVIWVDRRASEESRLLALIEEREGSA